MFQNVIMPEVSVSEMRGVMMLLGLIGNPKAKEAAELLIKLSAEKDAAVAAAKQAAADAEEARRLHAEVKAHHEERHVKLVTSETQLARRIDEHAAAAADLIKRENALREEKRAHSLNVAQLAERERSIDARDQKVIALERAAESQAKDLARARREHDERVEKLRAAVS